MPVNFAITGAWGDFTQDGRIDRPGCYPANAGSVLKISEYSSVVVFLLFRSTGGFHVEPVLGSSGHKSVAILWEGLVVPEKP